MHVGREGAFPVMGLMQPVLKSDSCSAWKGMSALKCLNCGEEIVLATRCPYCGTKVEKVEDSGHKDDRRPRGWFRGPVHGSNAQAGNRGGSEIQNAGPIAYLGALYRFLTDPEVSIWRKAVIAAAAGYVFFPLDFVPDIFFGLGWLDDAAVVALLWRYLSDELRRYLR